MNNTNNTFYSSFFKLNSFLNNKGRNFFYTDRAYLDSQGFNEGVFDGKVVLELGAGAGRLTRILCEYGFLESCKFYYIVEPSDGINEIKAYFKNSKYEDKIIFIKSDLENLNKFLDYNSIDYFLCTGVLPHIDLPLDQVASTIEKFIKNEGNFHLVYSYYGFNKQLGNLIRKSIYKYPTVAKITAFCNTLFHYLCFNLSLFRKFYISNFIYSPQNNFKDILLTYIEYYSVNPYNIQYNYEVTIKSFAQKKLYVDCLFNYSFAVLFKKQITPSLSFLDNSSFLNFENEELILVYLDKQDFFYNLVVRKIRKKYKNKLQYINYSDIEDFIGKRIIIFCWNYYTTPYYSKLKEKNITVGLESKVYFYQMCI